MAAGVDRVLGKVAAGRLAGRGSGWWNRWSHICMQINRVGVGTTGNEAEIAT